MKTEKEEDLPIINNNSNSAVRTELQEYLSIQHQRSRVFPRAALVGAGAGIIALAFRAALTGMDSIRNGLIGWTHHFPQFGWLLPIIFTAAGAFITVAITRRYAPEVSGSGIPHIEAVLMRFRKLDWKRVLPAKFIGGIIGIGSGLALGREGPTVQMGGAVGDAVARYLKVTEHERLVLISAGGGAGLAAAFNAPLAGLIFVLEELRRDFKPIVFGAAFVAAVVADIITRIGSNQFPVFSIPSYPVPPLSSLPIFALLGIITGFLGVLFNKCLLAALNLYAHIPKKYILTAAAITGSAIGIAGWFAPALTGSGNSLVESALQGDLILRIIPIFFVLRFIMTISSYATGAPGGIFAPLLVLGAMLGLALGQIANQFNPTVVPIPAIFAVVGMAAFFTSIVRAPLTGIMLIVEMTGNYQQMLPLLVSCFCAYAVSESLKDIPIYEALLERELKKTGDSLPILEPVVVDFTIHEGASFAGLTVRSLGLPAGCILVRCSDGKHEWVPKASTRLEAHMHITAVIAPDAENGLEVLRNGCSGASKSGEEADE